jgi:hypothetical protein
MSLNKCKLCDKPVYEYSSLLGVNLLSEYCKDHHIYIGIENEKKNENLIPQKLISFIY